MKIIPRLLCFLLVLLSVDVFSFCQKIELRNGVRIVHNGNEGKWGKDLKVSLKLIRTIGGIDTLDENLAFRSPYDIAMDKTGKIYILDNGNSRIQKFSANADYLATIGKRGQGPGDFNDPVSLDIDSNDYLYVSERGNNRIQIFSPEGNDYKIFRIDKYRPSKVRYLKSGLLAMGKLPRLIPPGVKVKSPQKLLHLFDLEGNLKNEFVDGFDFKNRLTNWMGNWFDFDVDKNDFFYLAFKYQNRIEKYSPDGNLLWKANRVLNFEMKPIDSHKIRIAGDEGPLPPEVSTGIAVDGKGRIWVLTMNRQWQEGEQSSSIYTTSGQITTKSGEIKKMDIFKLEIYGSDGILLGEIQLDHIAQGIRIYKNNLFIWEFPNARYFQYKIIEK
jgi:hypothetical protein